MGWCKGRQWRDGTSSLEFARLKERLAVCESESCGLMSGLTSRVYSVAAALALHSEPRCDHIVGEVSTWVLLGVVGHEAEDESVGRWLDEHSRERTVEEVWVVGDLGVESLGSEGGKRVDCDATRGGIDHLLELLSDGLVVVASLVEIWSGWRGITLVLVVGAGKSVAL